jgi:NAD(P)-dependent dehydrogenase (short-subunit alcohol dehydrogenase family)
MHRFPRLQNPIYTAAMISNVSDSAQACKPEVVHTAGTYTPSKAGLPEGYGEYSLANKTAIVTGGASGIGYAICLLFAKKGAHVMILDLQQSDADRVANELNTKYGNKNAVGYACDVSKRSDVEAAFEKIIKNKQRIDILVNNAGVPAVGNVEKCTDDDMKRQFNINIMGIYLCSQLAARHMSTENNGKGGVILNLASIASKIGLADRFAYSMSKGAALTMTYSIATDYVKKGIRCNCMVPARIHTPFVDAYLAKSYPGKEAEMFEKLSVYQPIG